MSDDNLPKWVKPLLEFGPVLAFFVAYLRMKGTNYTIGGFDYDGFILVTALFVPLLLVCTTILWKLNRALYVPFFSLLSNNPVSLQNSPRPASWGTEKQRCRR